MAKQSSTRDIVNFYWERTKAYPITFALTFVNIIQTVANTVLTPLMIGLAIQKLQDPSSVSLSFEVMIGLIIAWSIMGILSHRVAMLALNSLDIQVMKDIYRIIANHLMNESYDFHAKSFSGALLNQSTRLAQGYITFADTLALETQRNAVIVFISSIALAFYDPILAGLMFGMSIFGLGVAVYMARKRYPLRKQAVAAGTKQTAYLADMITNAINVKAFAAESFEEKTFNTYLDATAEKMHRSWKMGITGNNVTTAIAIMMNLVILVYGIHATKAGIISLGIFIAAQLYAVRITGSFWDLTRIIRTLETVFADAHEMTQILKIKPKIQDQPLAQPLKVTNGLVELRKVDFRYDDANASDYVFTNLSTTIQPGEKVGLVGHSGGGKTTITKLLLRFLDIQNGDILVDGQNIASVTQSSLRKHIAYVPQEPLLFHRSLADNIRYGQPLASDAEIVKAAKLAHAHEFIQKLPKQYDTEVGERGVKLSGGQRQRIAIARAILKDSPILVLDEATSALDSESEQFIQDALAKVMQGRTTIVVAHRLSTIQKLDRILVIGDGKIIEEGSHEQLIAKKGLYATLWSRQSGGFIEE